ncbi:YobA family protein [Paenibacillus sp. LS1]|uniref:YobA family protein n=1 Tax=Paenibacillus sp. LS1 TaxID=2992120 RepID=UPI0022327417|nr:YobA family protein [Paenibacillus sp. LS1]MCW3791212.1 YobA family protein [Paenibacillus sp. LS1]
MSNLRIVCTMLSIWILGLTGCTASNECKSAQTIANSPTEKGFTGYVVERKDDSILVVDPAFQDYSSNGEESRYYPAKWFSNAPDPQIGAYVEVWTDGRPENQPYPGQARAEKIAVSCPNTPEGAHLSEADAIRGGLYSPDGEKLRVPVIEDVQFDQDAGIWTIRMRDAMSTTKNQDKNDIRVEDVELTE